MREKFFKWLGQEFVSLSCEGAPSTDVTSETADIFERIDARLRTHGQSLDNTVRTRLWARDMSCWEPGVKERVRILSGAARSVSSSHIRPERFASQAGVAIDLLAMRAPSGEHKLLREYEPEGIVLRNLEWDGVLFLSGVTVILPEFDEQLNTIVGRITSTLRDARLEWSDVERASFFLHRSCSFDKLKNDFARLVPIVIPIMEYAQVDTRQGKLVEIEITASRKKRTP